METKCTVIVKYEYRRSSIKLKTINGLSLTIFFKHIFEMKNTRLKGPNEAKPPIFIKQWNWMNKISK